MSRLKCKPLHTLFHILQRLAELYLSHRLTSTYWTDLLKFNFISQRNKRVIGSRIYELSHYEIEDTEREHWISFDQKSVLEPHKESLENDFERISKSVQLRLKISSQTENLELFEKKLEKIFKLENPLTTKLRSDSSVQEAQEALPFPEDFLFPSDYLAFKRSGIIIKSPQNTTVYTEGQNPKGLFIVLEGS